MLNSYTAGYTDDSDEQVFRFIFYCDCCGKPMTATPITFIRAGLPDDDASEAGKQLFEMAWQKQHDAAFRRANAEIWDKMFRCPACLEVVCYECVRGAGMPGGGVTPRCKRCSGAALKKPFGFQKEVSV